MPGGKAAVYTGILPYTQNETGLAVVLGHEVAHTLADHGNERMSQALTGGEHGRHGAFGCPVSAVAANSTALHDGIRRRGQRGVIKN